MVRTAQQRLEASHMLGRITVVACGLVLLARASGSWTACIDPLRVKRELATLVPGTALVYVEAPGLSELIARGVEHPLVARVLASPIGVAFGNAEAVERALRPLQPALGPDPLATLAAATSNGAALALVPREGEKPAAVLVLRALDAQLLAGDLARALGALGRQFGLPHAFDRPNDEELGAELWNVGPELVVARRETLLVLANDGGVVRSVLELAADADARGLAEEPGFASRVSGAAESAAISAWLDLEALRSLPEGGEKLQELARLPAQPAVHFLLGSSVAVFPTARTLCAWLTFEGDERVVLGARASGADELALVRARLGEDAPPLPAVRATDVGRALLFRDNAAVLQHRAELFPAEVLPSLAQPLSQFALFFGGKDLAEEVLPRVSPWIALVAREVEFDAGAVPEIPLPALAALFRLEDAGSLGAELTAAFQTIVAIANVDRAQKVQAPLLLGLTQEDGVTITRASFLPPADGEGVDLRYNLEPACALVGDVFVLGTHERLVAELVRELRRGAVDGTTPRREQLSLAAPALARLVAANREALVWNAVLDEGKTREKAEGDIDGLHALLELLEGATLELAQDGDVVDFKLALELCDEGVTSAPDGERR